MVNCKIKSCKKRIMILCLHEGSVGFQRNEKLCVKNIDRWTYELAVLQGQIGIALLRSHATVSKPSALSLFHHILHINKTAREWSEGDKGRKRKERGRERGKTEKERGKQIDRLVSRSVIVILVGWMNVFDGHCRFRQRRVSENERNWFGPSGGESMCEGHVSAVVLFCAGL